MNEFIKQNWFKIIIALVLIAMSGSFFYWYSFRPAKIIKICQQRYDQCIDNKGLNLSAFCTTNLRETIYKNCLRSYGLEK